MYARLLTKFCHKFKTKTSVKEIISVVKMLLSQNLFLPSKRGKWYEILVQALESTKDNKAAAEVLVEALKDPFVDEVQYLTLQLRGQSILKRKNNKITDANLKDLLDDLCTVSVQEPSSIEIRGKALEQNKSGFKTVYVEENEEGKLFTSVEERALLHYKASGFSRGWYSFHLSCEKSVLNNKVLLICLDFEYKSQKIDVFSSLAAVNIPCGTLKFKNTQLIHAKHFKVKFLRMFKAFISGLPAKFIQNYCYIFCLYL